MGLLDNITTLAFLANLDDKGYYLMFLCSPETAQKRYEQYTRTGRYDETGKKDPYGYPEFNISAPVCHTLPVENERHGELFLSFIKDKKVAGHIEIKLAPSWGWFKFSETIDVEKWFREFELYETQRQNEYMKTNNAGLQPTLF